jgi:hypothetical protein
MSKKQKASKLTPDVLKSYTLDEVEDKHIGEKGAPKRDAYEAELQADLDLQNVKNNFDNDEWKYDTEAKPESPEAAAAAPDKRYGKELELALSHLAKRGEVLTYTPSKDSLDQLTQSHDRLIVCYPGKDNDYMIAEMAKRYFVLHLEDTQYLRTAVRVTDDHRLYQTLLVFDKRNKG